MSDVRNDLYPILQDVAKVPLGESFTPHANRILAAVRAALLSPEAVEAAGKILYDNRVIELDQSGDDDWDTLPWQDEWIEGAKDALIGALNAIGAAGITEGSDDE